jgi:serine/threonine protein kinase
MLCGSSCAAAVVALLFLALATRGDETNWAPWLSLPHRRTGAQALLVDHYLFIVGGSHTPQPFRNLSAVQRSVELNTTDNLAGNSGSVASSSSSSSSSMNSDSTPVILYVDVVHAYAFAELRIGQRVPLLQLVAKCGSAVNGRSIYMSYACGNDPGGSRFFVEVILPQDLTQLGSTESLVVYRNASRKVRSYSTLACIKRSGQVPGPQPGLGPSTFDHIPATVIALYLFGGRDPSGNFVREIELFDPSLMVWQAIGMMPLGPNSSTFCSCSATQIQAGSSQFVIMLHGCIDCASGLPLHQSVLFDAETRSFFGNISAARPLNDSNPNYLPSNDGGAALSLGFFAPTIYEIPGPAGPVINMYDTINLVQNTIVTITIQQRRTECAQFGTAATMFCLGGTTLDGKSTSFYSDFTQVLPAPIVNLNSPTSSYLTGENVIVYPGSTCGTSSARLRLATSVTCENPVPLVSDINCTDDPAVFETAANIVLRDGETLNTYLCYTYGSCVVDPGDRVPCGANATHDNCRWVPCCWDNVLKQCYSHVSSDTIVEQENLHWISVTSAPIPFSNYVPPPKGAVVWYENKWFNVALGACGGVVGYFILAFLWRRRTLSEVSKKKEMRNNLFTTFGKDYKILAQIGQGSFGTVFLAERTSDGRQVAMKVLPCADAKQRNLALAEYDLIHGMKHPNLLQVLDLILNWDTSTSGSGSREVQRRALRKLASHRKDGGDFTESYDEFGEDVTGSSPSVQRSLLSVPTTPSARDEPRGYGSFMQAVTFAEAGAVNKEDVDFIAACPRFICIVSEYCPDGDLGEFALNFTGDAPDAFVHISKDSFLREQQSPKSTNSREPSSPPPSGAKAAPSPASQSKATRSATPLPDSLVRNIICQICSVLHYMHCRAKPIVHRDLKPENVLMSGDRVVVTDFGLAGAQDAGTAASKQAGTLLFAPPESFANQATPAGDMWAVGCIAYAICTKRVQPDTARIMFADVDDADFQSSILHDLAGYSKEMQDVVLSLLVKDPLARITARDVIVQLGGAAPPSCTESFATAKSEIDTALRAESRHKKAADQKHRRK